MIPVFTLVSQEAVEQLRELSHTTFLAAYSGQIEEAEMRDYLEASHSIEVLSEELASPDIDYFFVYTGEELAGFCMLRRNQTHPNLGEAPATLLNRIYLLPAHWGSGLAAQMIQFCEAYARDAGSQWLWLQVWQENQRAIAFYRKCGFAHFGYMDFQLGDVVHQDWVMRKETIYSK